MEALDQKTEHNHDAVAADPTSLDAANASQSAANSKGSSLSEADLTRSLNQAFSDIVETTPTTTAAEKAAEVAAVPDDHDHAPPPNGQITHLSLDGLQASKTLDASRVRKDSLLPIMTRTVRGGDILDPGAGKNTVIGGRGSDLIFGDGGGFNTITTGGGAGRDTIVLGRETTNRIFDFDPTKDRFLLADNLTTDDIIITQGKNPGKGGLDQPTDSTNNALIIDKSNGHILGALTFTKAESLTERNFHVVDDNLLEETRNDPRIARLFKNQEGGGQLNGTRGRDRMVGDAGDNFLYVGDDGFTVSKASGTGPKEFPFPNDSPGVTELTTELKGGVLRVNGNYRDFDGAPLFSQNEKEIDPKAIILNGSNPQALVEGFLKVPKDVEGNLLSGTHLHFSPAEDARGNFADATVLRFFNNTATDAKSGTIAGEFELKPEEQAAFLAGNLYVNVHSNVDVDGDGKGGFPTGETRINYNRNVIKFV